MFTLERGESPPFNKMDFRSKQTILRQLPSLLSCLEPEERLLQWFPSLITKIAQKLRDNALNGKAEMILEIPGLFTLLTAGPELEECWRDSAKVEEAIRRMKRWVRQYQDGEMAYCVEEDFVNGVIKAMRAHVEAHTREKKRRLELWNEDLIASVLHPARAERMGTAHGMDGYTWLMVNSGYEP